MRWYAVVPASIVLALAVAFLARPSHQGTSTAADDNDPSRRTQTEAAYQPHILFVMMDDLGSNDLGYHGSGIKTPVADNMLKSGLRLRNFYTLPTCTLTRIAALTGRYPYRSGTYEVVRSASTKGMAEDEETIAQILKRAGYQTHAVGKWHLGHSKWTLTPTFRGFMTFFGFHVSGMQDYFDHTSTIGNGKQGYYDMRWESRERCGWACSQQVQAKGIYSSTLFAQEAIRTINTYDASKGPMFMYLAFQAVYVPTIPVRPTSSPDVSHAHLSIQT